uniref:radical SAM protein n=1 Tax=Eubacterium cellulosolvens TaxID=29322 RepID=UPI00047FAE6B|nr:radical SAM protein [[Eubacterium] cellulosolvens]
MIWDNPGHQLDIQGNKYLKIKNIYLFGFDEVAKKMYDFLKWLKIDDDFNILFIWDKTEHEDVVVPCIFCGKQVVIYDEHNHPDQIVNNKENSIVVFKSRSQTRRLDRIRKMLGDDTSIFFMEPSIIAVDNFIQSFICIYMMYKYNKLVSHWTNYLITSKCNLNCEHCLNFNNYLKKKEDGSLDAFREHFDTLFGKFDYLYSLHFTGGETQLAKDFCKKIEILEQYKDRIFEFFVITNGTIIPPDENLHALKAMNGWVLIDDYSDSVKATKIDQITEKLNSFGIKYCVSKAQFWYDLSVDCTNYSTQTPKELELHKDACNRYLHEFADGNIYACCYQEYAHRANKGGIDEDDYIRITEKSKMEILEFRQGYSSKGYTSLCPKCRGLGELAVKVPAAIQTKR